MSQNDYRILVVEDDVQIQKFICYALDNEGYLHAAVDTGNKALECIAGERVDLLLLDLGLPDMDGMQIIYEARKSSDMPIIVVSARDQEKEKVAALDAGADDYLTKPFSATELLARIRVAIRHLSKNSGTALSSVMTVGGLQLDSEKHQVYLNGNELHTTPTEYRLLSLLFQHAGKVLTTAYIIKEIWGPGYGSDTQVLRTLMAGLRRKIEETPARPRYILTEIGVGYRLADE